MYPASRIFLASTDSISSNTSIPSSPLILYIDKPAGITSFDVIRQLRRRLNIRKMGHAGTLDPLATGLLIIAVENDTKRISTFMNLDKEYEVTMEFGKTSDSYDADGKITVMEPAPEEVPEGKIKVIAAQFVGAIMQVPPAYSAVKVKGVRSYDRARAGEKVVLEPRPVKIHSIELLEYKWPFATIRAKSSKGMYVRSLVHDIGQKLGVGAYVTALRRTAIGPHRVETAQKIDDVTV